MKKTKGIDKARQSHLFAKSEELANQHRCIATCYSCGWQKTAETRKQAARYAGNHLSRYLLHHRVQVDYRVETENGYNPWVDGFPGY